MASFDPVATTPSGARLPPFHTLAKHSFVGIPFRVENVTIRGGIREHVHEYGRLPGGVAELLGRRLYEFEYDAVFATNDPEFPDAWPGTIGTFRGFWEQQQQGDLVVSTIGKVLAYATSWTIVQTNKAFNLERVKITFRESAETDLLTPEGVVVLKSQPLAAQAQNIVDLGVALQKKPNGSFGIPNVDVPALVSPDFLTSILDYAKQIQGLVQMTKLRLDSVAQRATAMADMIRSFSDLEASLNDPGNWKMVQALNSITVAADQLARDSLRKVAPLTTYVTPKRMSVVEVSIAFYGDTSRAMEIMQMNAFVNPFAIPEGTRVKVYADYSPGGVLRAA